MGSQDRVPVTLGSAHRPLHLARDPSTGPRNLAPPRPRPPVGPRTNWSYSASPEAGLVPQPRCLRLKSLSGRLSHPINAPSCTHYVSHDRQCAATGATGQRSNHLFTIPTDNTGTVSCRRTSRTIPPDGCGDPHPHLGHFSGLGTTGYEGRRASAIHQSQ